MDTFPHTVAMAFAVSVLVTVVPLAQSPTFALENGSILGANVSGDGASLPGVFMQDVQRPAGRPVVPWWSVTQLVCLDDHGSGIACDVTIHMGVGTMHRMVRGTIASGVLNASVERQTGYAGDLMVDVIDAGFEYPGPNKQPRHLASPLAGLQR